MLGDAVVLGDASVLADAVVSFHTENCGILVVHLSDPQKCATNALAAMTHSKLYYENKMLCICRWKQ